MFEKITKFMPRGYYLFFLLISFNKGGCFYSEMRNQRQGQNILYCTLLLEQLRDTLKIQRACSYRVRDANANERFGWRLFCINLRQLIVILIAKTFTNEPPTFYLHSE